MKRKLVTLTTVIALIFSLQIIPVFAAQGDDGVADPEVG